MTALYRNGWTHGIDHDVAALFATVDEQWLDTIAEWDDALARPRATFAMALIMSIALARGRVRWAWSVPLLIVVTAFIELLVKVGIRQVFHPGELVRAASELLGVRYDAGAPFPSGHVARTTFLAVVAAMLKPGWSTAALVAFAAVTCLARIYIGAHHLTDVLGGVALGAFVAAAGLWSRAVVAGRAGADTR